MTRPRIPIPKLIQDEILFKTNNRCCICQTPFIQFHHIDSNRANNDSNNIAPLCPNCHTQAHSESNMINNLTPSRIQKLRDKWYEYCENRKEGANISPNALLKIKNFVRSLGYAEYSWKSTFAILDPSYGEMSREEIVNRVFSTSNRDELVTALETVKNMYGRYLIIEKILEKFKIVCNSFGIDYDELI